MKKSTKWSLFLVFLAGIVLRMIFVNDMEYKEDEEYNFVQTQLVGNSQPWPWIGMPSGVYIPNPGMSIWVFIWLAKFFGVHDPTTLAHAVQIVALLGIFLIIPFALKFVKNEEREPWLWAFALALVNPFLIVYQRKLWPEPFMCFFIMLTLMGFWRREKKCGAFTWGFFGAWIGQIHMGGFFFAFSIFLWELLFERKKPKWFAWFMGSTLGALPLIPWLLEWMKHPTEHTISAGFQEMIQLKYWVFWVTDSLGLHLGNSLGLLRSEVGLKQITDFIRYPLIEGHPSYIGGFAHIVILFAGIWIFMLGIASAWKQRSKILDLALGRSSDSALVQSAAFWGCGLILTATGVVIRRYYLASTFPFEFLWLARIALSSPRVGRRLLATLVVSEFLVSALFVGYVHVNQGSPQGDYGDAYHLIKQVDGRTGRYSWDPHPPGISK